MTPPCPNCGCIYSEGPAAGTSPRTISIASTTILESDDAGRVTFLGTEYECQRCLEKWRVPHAPYAPSALEDAC